MDGSVVFAMWRQCALPWWHIGATWWIQSNLCFIWPTGVNNPNSKSIGSAIFAQLAADCRYTLQWAAPFPLKITLSHLGSGPHLTHDSLCTSEPATQTASRSAVFAQMTVECRYILQWDIPCPLKIAPSHGDLDSTLYMVPWAHPSLNPNGISSRFCTAH